MTGPNWEVTDVIGFVFEDLPGLADTYLPASPGLTVLYGLNGAGKTRILQAIAGAYRGVRGGAQLLIRVPNKEAQPADWEPDDEDDTWRPADHYKGQVKAELSRAWSPQRLAFLTDASEHDYVSDATFEQVYREALEEFVDPTEHEHVDPFLGELDAQRIVEIRDEMLRQRLILITPMGSLERPAWTVSPAAMDDPDYPALSEELRRMQRTQWWQDAGEDPDEVLHPDHGEPWDGFAYKMVGHGLPLIGAARGEYHNHSAPITLPRLALEPVEFEEEDPDRLVRESIRRISEREADLWNQLGPTIAREPWEVWNSAEANLTSWASATLTLIENCANDLYAGVLLDAPHLRLTVRSLQQWWAGRPVTWSFGPRDLSPDLMSSAELRWARWAIAHAVRQTEDGLTEEESTPLTLIDEPERALHRSAEAHMAARLQTFAEEEGRRVIVSTHSPELLNLSSVRLLEVRRDLDGVSVVSTLTVEHRAELEALGLLPSDLLRRQRGFVMVEGEHDEKLFEHWIGPQLRSMRLSLLNLRGAKNLPATIESQVLFEFTDAHIFVVLDNLRTDVIEKAWSEARRLKKTESDQQAVDHLLEKIGKKTAEDRWIGEWLSRALTRNKDERLTPFSIEVPDIIDLVDVRHLVPRATSWSDLRAEYAASGAADNFKKWLSRTKGARFETERIVQAAPSEPPEVVRDFLCKAASVLDA